VLTKQVLQTLEPHLHSFLLGYVTNIFPYFEPEWPQTTILIFMPPIVGVTAIHKTTPNVLLVKIGSYKFVPRLTSNGNPPKYLRYRCEPPVLVPTDF
jgi:hypothetical protein